MLCDTDTRPGTPDARAAALNLDRSGGRVRGAGPDLAFGVAAPYEAGADLDYHHLFSLDWGLIAPPGHPLLRKKNLTLADLVGVPLIVFERGSTGRQHVLDAFRGLGLSPRVDMEA